MKLETASPPVFGKENDMSKEKVALRAEGLSFKYPGSSDLVLKEIDFEIEGPGVYLLLGRTGSGKSTLIHLLTGIIPWLGAGDLTGSLRVLGSDPASTPLPHMPAKPGVLLQSPEVQFFHRTVTEELGSCMDRKNSYAEAFGLPVLIDRKVDQLSVGERKKVALSRLLLGDYPLLIMDEPFTNLDRDARAVLIEWMKAISREKVLFISTHVIPEKLLTSVRAFLILEGGKLEFFENDDGIVRDRLKDYIGPGRFVPLGKPGRNGKPEVIELEGIAFEYGEREVLNDLSLRLTRGSIVGIHGSNGSGKTTLLRIVARLLKPGKGVIRGSPRPGLLFQDPERQLLFASVEREIAFSARDKRQIGEILERVGLADKLKVHVSELSYGEKERLALAAILAADPDILLLDEPSQGLDLVELRRLAGILREERERGKSMIIVSHDLEFLETLSDAVYELRGGKLHEK